VISPFESASLNGVRVTERRGKVSCSSRVCYQTLFPVNKPLPKIYTLRRPLLSVARIESWELGSKRCGACLAQVTAVGTDTSEIVSEWNVHWNVSRKLILIFQDYKHSSVGYNDSRSCTSVTSYWLLLYPEFSSVCLCCYITGICVHRHHVLEVQRFFTQLQWMRSILLLLLLQSVRKVWNQWEF
jgi:hypothetical protein